jgi:predicted ABC-class ATPase
LPARGRSVLGQWASSILLQNLPRYVQSGLLYAQLDRRALQAHVECVEDTQALREQLPGLGLVAFVGDGSILPRKSGASDEPMPAHQAVPFRAPDSLAVTLQLPNRGAVRGLGIRRGVTLICGGGFHGKTTLLKAIEAGVYNKVPRDGRELIATDPTAVKIRAEDGRRVEAVNISPFIANLPFGKDTTNFATPDASGSTSQAANIQEALEVGARTLLVDEDTSATNFMIRDARMQELVSGAREPITPFIVKLPALAAQRGVSCVLVIGGSGQYFDVADTVICMDEYLPADVTAQAQAISRRHAGPGDSLPRPERYGDVTPRTLSSGKCSARLRLVAADVTF